MVPDELSYGMRRAKVWPDSFGFPDGAQISVVMNVLPMGLRPWYLSVYWTELILSCFLNTFLTFTQ